MSYQALARKWRPQTFRDIIGQETVVRTLQNAIEQQRIHHAYLFSGVRGVGKTTAARILAKAINCVNGPTAEPCNTCSICREITEGIDMDVREIDAATYTQVDNIRDLREVTQFQPARDRYRIFIIDEAHMLTTPAWNALLKLIEEPPPHVLFILATTEMQKVPATILSRVQRFVFNKITYVDVMGRLTEIIQHEGMQAEPAALEIVARRGEGSVRDSLSILDQIIAFSGRSITASDVTMILGLSEIHFFARLANHISEGDNAAILEALGEAADNGRDFKLLYRDFLAFLRNLLLLRSGAPEAMLAVTADERTILEATASRFDASELLRLMNLLIRDDEIVTKSEQQRLAVEITLLKAATLPRLRAVEAILEGSPTPSPANRGLPRDKTASAKQKAEAQSPSGSPASLPAPKSRSTEARPAAAQSSGPAEMTAAGQPVISDRIESNGTDLRDRIESNGPALSERSESSGTDLREAVLARIRGLRKHSTASYLDMATQWNLDGDRLTIAFEADRKFAQDHLSNDAQSQVVSDAVSDARGAKTSVKFVAASTEPSPERPTEESHPQQDPVLRAFAKHLGGEVIPQKRKKQETP